MMTEYPAVIAGFKMRATSARYERAADHFLLKPVYLRTSSAKPGEYASIPKLNRGEETDFILRLLATGLRGRFDRGLHIHHPRRDMLSGTVSLERAKKYGAAMGVSGASPFAVSVVVCAAHLRSLARADSLCAGTVCGCWFMHGPHFRPVPGLPSPGIELRVTVAEQPRQCRAWGVVTRGCSACRGDDRRCWKRPDFLGKGCVRPAHKFSNIVPPFRRMSV